MSEDKLHILDYTAKSIVVIGNCIDHSTNLQKLGGKYNPNLRCGNGWVFSKTRKESVEKYINTGKVDPLIQTKNWESSSSISKLVKEIIDAFDSDEEYTGQTIHEVVKSIEKNYST
jgi:hypothetical protein